MNIKNPQRSEPGFMLFMDSCYVRFHAREIGKFVCLGLIKRGYNDNFERAGICYNLV